MIYEAMGWEPPQFGHLSLVLDEDRQKLSKRRGATSCHEFMLEGYAPEALKNFVLLLGWSHPEGKEILNFDDMISSFDITRFNSAGAVFDAVKLKWMNGQYLRGFSNKELWLRLEPFIKKAGLDFSGKTAEWTESAVQVLKTSFDTLVEGADAFKTFSDDLFTVWPESQEVLLWPTTKAVLSAWKRSLEAERSSLSTDDFLRLQKNIQESCKVKGKELFMALRVAVLGKPHGYELKLFVPLLTKESLLLRVNSVLEKLNQDER
jgi:nondiscriminating glutamyl-tRNA synthetase